MMGCSGTRKEPGPITKRPVFRDPEIASFIGETDKSETEVTQPEAMPTLAEETKLTIPVVGTPVEVVAPTITRDRERPIWAHKSYLEPNSARYLGRNGYGVLNGRIVQEVIDSVHFQLRADMARDIETRVKSWVEDSVVTKTTSNRKSSEYVRKIIFKTYARSWSPTITFSRDYYRRDNWLDSDSDSVWCLIQFDFKEYKDRAEQHLIQTGKDAYKYLVESYDQYYRKNNVQQALKALGVASYYISKGGGVFMEPNLFNTSGDAQYVAYQRSELLTNMQQDIKLALTKPNSKLTIKSPEELAVKLVSRNPKKLNLNGVSLRVSVEGDYIDYPVVKRLNENEVIIIPFSIKSGALNYGDKAKVVVTYDVISTLIPEAEWVDGLDYSELQQELPSVEFLINIQPLSIFISSKEMSLGESISSLVVTPAVMSAVNEKIGTQFTSDKSKSDYVMVIDIKTRKGQKSSVTGYHTVIGVMNIDLLKGDTVLASKRYEVKGVHFTYEEAANDALRKLSKKAQETVGDDIVASIL